MIITIFYMLFSNIPLALPHAFLAHPCWHLIIELLLCFECNPIIYSFTDLKNNSKKREEREREREREERKKEGKRRT